MSSSIRLISCILVLVFCNNIYSQSSILEKKITGDYKNIPLKAVLADISKNTNIRFSYSPEKIPEDAKITVSFSQVSLQDALETIFKNLPVHFELVDSYIVLTKTIEKNEKPKEEKHYEPIKMVTLSGYIKDSTTGEFLLGATLYIRDLKIGTTTNSYGFFSLSIPLGKYNIEVSYLGFEPLTKNVDLASSLKLDFSLRQGLQKLEEIVVSSVSKKEVDFKRRASQTEVLPSFVAQLPAIMGEPDVIKSLEFQPGILFYGDGSSYFHVRGGNYDQNLVILDEATIFNPSHLLGIFSPIIPDAIKNVDIYKADYPVNFGGRLSSVVDIHTKDGNRNNFSASGNIGLISARATIEGPIFKEKSSYFISFRRSYFDAYIKPSQPSLQGLYFNDFTIKLNFQLNPNNRLFFTFYNGKDVLRIKQGTDDSNGINWGNTSGTLRWNHIFGSKVFLNTTFCLSSYNYYLYTSVKNNTYWNSRIETFSFKEELSYFITPKLTWRVGLKISAYGFNPGHYYNPASSNNIQVSPINSSEIVLFAGAEHEIFPWLRLNYGIRFTSWANTGEAFVVQYDNNHNKTGIQYYTKNEKFYKSPICFEPRLSSSIRTGEVSNIKLSYSRTYQFLNLITNSISPFNSLEVWLPSGPNIKPQYADITDLGYNKSMGKFSFQTDVYYKRLYNQIGYKSHASMLVNPEIEGELRQGDGQSYGFETSIKKESGRFTGGIEYTYSRAFLKINDVNNSEKYPASFDRPHNLSFDLTFQAKPRWIITANYHIMSGMRVTTPTSFYYYRGYQTPIYNQLNNDQLPTYRRFDISTTIILNKPFRKYNHSLNIAIVNLFGQVNPVFLYFNKYKQPDGNLVVPVNQLKQENIIPTIRYIYGVIPSISYQFRF